jgi:hypothetical protein
LQEREHAIEMRGRLASAELFCGLQADGFGIGVDQGADFFFLLVPEGN